MALSNILREPRREITETLIGALVIGAVLYGDHFFAEWMYAGIGQHDRSFIIVCYLIGALLGVLIFFFAIFVHWIGESICGSLARHGLELRPKVRRRGC